MRRFLVLFDDLPIDKASVKSGANSSEVVTACRCVNVGLFLSGNLRRDVIVSIATGPIDDLRVISFLGETLKRVSPDERSISFFLLKSLDMAMGLAQDSQKVMDNGIIVRREAFKHLITAYRPDNVFVAYRGSTPDSDSSYKLENALLVYDTGTCIDVASSKIMPGKYRKLPCPSHPERFILDVNDRLDDNTSDT
ncbi:MAG: hypothetical protein C4K48_10425 [Candidatus Thorarchaeota archaeon]|nr:MAG: hypothetical protein C4K48_10425 [Candidatus Thorarchaeota archaeon]